MDDPSQYGVVLHEKEEKEEQAAAALAGGGGGAKAGGGGRVLKFVEKPQTYVGNCINAGQLQ